MFDLMMMFGSLCVSCFFLLNANLLEMKELVCWCYCFWLWLIVEQKYSCIWNVSQIRLTISANIKLFFFCTNLYLGTFRCYSDAFKIYPIPHGYGMKGLFKWSNCLRFNCHSKEEYLFLNSPKWNKQFRHFVNHIKYSRSQLPDINK